MASIPEAIRRFAEEPDEFLPEPLPPARCVRAPTFSLFLSYLSRCRAQNP